MKVYLKNTVMNKYIINILAGGLILLTGCNKFLDEVPVDIT